MRKIASTLIVLAVISCTRKIDYYQGYIFDSSNNPQKNLTVEGRDHSDIKALTNNNGFFRLEVSDDFIETFLYIKKNENKIDSIQVIRTQGGEKIKFSFVNGRKDTLFIKMK